MNPWHWLLDTLRWGLTEFHDLFEPAFGEHAWGWAIVALTLVIRVFLLPLAAKQFKSMRGMQALSPEMQRIKKKYKVDRDLMKKNPEKYKAQRQKMNEEVMNLYQEHGVNPAASCLPLLLQAPIFFALFRILWAEGERIEEMVGASFYVFTPLEQAANATVWGWVLVVLMAGTMFLAQKQMMARNPQAEGMAATQQKVMLYGMPVFLTFVAQQLPKGVLIYWVTTNLWQVVQQTLILRQIQKDEAEGGSPGAGGKGPGKGGPGKGGPKGGADGGDADGGRKSWIERMRERVEEMAPDVSDDAADGGEPDGRDRSGGGAGGGGSSRGRAGPDHRRDSGHIPKRRRRDE